MMKKVFGHSCLKAFSAAILMVILFAGTVYAQPQSIYLDSGEIQGNGFVSIDETFETCDGKMRELIMTGLKPGNKDLMLKCLSEHYQEGEDPVPLKIIDEAFCDAEKYDNSDEQAGYDSLQCWAASAANMLWISGWTDYLEYPEGMQLFSSEDEIFQLYNARFTDRGGDIDRAIDWFFMGEFFVSGTKKSAALMEPEAEDGFLKGFVSSLAQNRYDLTENTSDIRQLLKIRPNPEDLIYGQSVFQGSTGSLIGGELLDSFHSVTVIGVIIDPAAEQPEEQFRAVVIIDSDNDAVPDEEEIGLVQSLTAEDEKILDDLQKEEKARLKAKRPNSYTVYPLRCIQDINGTACWEIVGYSDYEDEYWEPEIVYSINELFVPSDALIESLWEKEGSLDHINDPDLTLDTLFMTGDPEGFTDPYIGRINQVEHAVVTEFAYGEAVRLNYFVSNRSHKSIDLDAGEEILPSLTWKVTRESDEVVVAEGTHLCELPILAGYECSSDQPDLITVNKINEQILPLEPGEYILTAELNKDHTVREAYYRNNQLQTLRFSVLDNPDGMMK